MQFEIEPRLRGDKNETEFMKMLLSRDVGEVPIWHEGTTPLLFLNSSCADLSQGFKLCFEMNPLTQEIKVILKYQPTELGSWLINRSNSTVHIGVDFRVFEISLDLTANFESRELNLKGKIKWPFGSARFDEVVYRW